MTRPFEMALVENIQREDLHIEIAISFKRLIDECELTHESLGTVGQKPFDITNYVHVAATGGNAAGCSAQDHQHGPHCPYRH